MQFDTLLLPKSSRTSKHDDTTKERFPRDWSYVAGIIDQRWIPFAKSKLCGAWNFSVI